jgi:hypothetical protein
MRRHGGRGASANRASTHAEQSVNIKCHGSLAIASVNVDRIDFQQRAFDVQPQPMTQILQDEFCVVVLDNRRKLFDVRFPSRSDERANLEVSKANNDVAEPQWSVFTAWRGPGLAEQVRSAAQAANPHYQFVHSALAAIPVPVKIISNNGATEWI